MCQLEPTESRDGAAALLFVQYFRPFAEKNPLDQLKENVHLMTSSRSRDTRRVSAGWQSWGLRTIFCCNCLGFSDMRMAHAGPSVPSNYIPI
jgi:hypothetical protein